MRFGMVDQMKFGMVDWMKLAMVGWMKFCKMGCATLVLGDDLGIVMVK